jgi:hypothetical protein
MVLPKGRVARILHGLVRSALRRGVSGHHGCMADIAAMVDELGGMAQKRQLVARGARDIDLTLAVRRGEVYRAMQGWYTTLPDSDPRVRAIRVGGRLTGISAILFLGGWVFGKHPLHVSVHRNAARLRTPWNRFKLLAGRVVPSLRLHWDDASLGERGETMVVSLADALYRVYSTSPWRRRSRHSTGPSTRGSSTTPTS